MDNFATLALEHLLLRLRPLNRALRYAVNAQSELAAQLVRPDVAPLCVTEDQVNKILGRLDRQLMNPETDGPTLELNAQELEEEVELRELAESAGVRLPFDYLNEELALTSFEQEAILICAAVEIDRGYERIYAYILDDLNRRFPCVDLLCGLTAGSIGEQLARRQALSRYGRLRGTGILKPSGDAATESRQEFRLAPEMIDFVAGMIETIDGLFIDRADVPTRGDVAPVFGSQTIRRFGNLIRAGQIDTVGVWGASDTGHEDYVLALAGAAGRRVRRLLVSDLEQQLGALPERLREILHATSVHDAILWVNTNDFAQPEQERMRAALAQELCDASCPVVLTGLHSWRPTRMLEQRNYVEFDLPPLSYEQRQSLWLHALPELQKPDVASFAARFHLNSEEVRAVARVARTQAWAHGNGHPAAVSQQLDYACATVTRKSNSHFASLIQPRRGPDDLILTPDLHRQVMEIAKFVRVGPLVDETWGFGHLSAGGSGVKVLMTGESGTGKTLAAEVIAHTLSLHMLKIDLSRVVSKWVGESERNLELVFREAEETNSVLVFDECESLFGRRGEIQSGTDRYSNLEVGYLLQRLESFCGLAILTSNLKDQIDSAFTRRFQVVLHFPLPAVAERRRIWQLAFPSLAPVGGVDLEVLQSLDLSGAGIVASARIAALLAADERSECIGMSHVVKAVARQYQREARLLSATQLGRYATLL